MGKLKVHKEPKQLLLTDSAFLKFRVGHPHLCQIVIFRSPHFLRQPHFYRPLLITVKGSAAHLTFVIHQSETTEVTIL